MVDLLLRLISKMPNWWTRSNKRIKTSKVLSRIWNRLQAPDWSTSPSTMPNARPQVSKPRKPRPHSKISRLRETRFSNRSKSLRKTSAKLQSWISRSNLSTTSSHTSTTSCWRSPSRLSKESRCSRRSWSSQPLLSRSRWKIKVTRQTSSMPSPKSWLWRSTDREMRCLWNKKNWRRSTMPTGKSPTWNTTPRLRTSTESCTISRSQGLKCKTN